MSEVSNLDLELEPTLRRMFMAYGNIPERDPGSARRTRDKFLAEINNTLLEPTLPRSIKGFTGQSFTRDSWIPGLMRLKEAFIPIEKSMILRGFVTLMWLGAFLFGGAGITVYAASSSLPGDAIYPLKTTLENARANFTLDVAAQDRLYLEYAGRRLSEIQSLIEHRRYTDVAYAEIEFERDIQKALGAVESLSKTDPARAAALNAENNLVLRNYVEILIQMITGVPADVEPIIQRAINASQSAADDGDDDAGNGTGGGLTSMLTKTATAPDLTPSPHLPTVTATTLTPAPTPAGLIFVPTPNKGGSLDSGTGDANSGSNGVGGDDDSNSDDDGGDD